MRLLPMVAISAFCLFSLKAVSLYFEGGTILTGHAPATAQSSDRLPENLPRYSLRAGKVDPDLVTGASEEKKPAQKEDDDPNLKAGPDFKAAKSEFAILQSLANRRKKLDEREKQLILQRNLLKAAEQKLESRIAEMKSLEARFSGDEKQKKSSQSERYRKLVDMYSKMKPADAAKIFDRLDVETLMGLVEHMNSRAMASILSAMDPAKAESLTVHIANQGKADAMNTKSLPKIKSE